MGAFLSASAAWSQTPAKPPAELEQQYDAAFQEMLRQPANLDVLFKFATLASQTGDLEGSVSALERMLLINPALPRVRLELGVLYFRLGSYEVARTYLEVALQSAALPPEVRGRAEQFMKEIRARAIPSTFAGETFLGWRYQSNANFGPPTTAVLLFGQSANLNSSSVGTADWGAVASFQVKHSYDFGNQDKSALETQFTAYANRQFQLAAANVSLIDLTIGPRFQVFNGIFEDVTLKPMVLGGNLWVNDTSYYGSYGGGLESGILLTDRLRNVSTVLWRKHDHPDTWYLPLNSLYKGTEYTANTNFQFQLTNQVTLMALGSGTRYETDRNLVQNYELLGAGGGMSFRFADPLFKSTLPWAISVTYTYQWWKYDIADVTIDPTRERRQLDSIINLTLAIPFDPRTTFTVTGGRFSRTSNLPNYELDNNNVMFGIGWRF